MVKADMDYLKGMIKHLQEKGSVVTGANGGSGNSESGVIIPSGMIFAASADTFVSEPMPEASAPSFDVAL